MAKKCDICGKPLQSEGLAGVASDLFGSDYGGQCRVCNKACCKTHIDKDKVCTICQKKLKEE